MTVRSRIPNAWRCGSEGLWAGVSQRGMKPRRGLAACAAACAGLIGLAGCASVPAVSPLVGRAAAPEKPDVVGPRGPLSGRRIKTLLAHMTIKPGDDALLQRHLAVEQAVSDTPLVADERTQLLRDGPVTLKAMFDVIRSARTEVDLEYYILEDVESDGTSLSDLLLEKRKAGVAINILYDSYGSTFDGTSSSDTRKAFFDRLRSAGVNLVEFNPVNPLNAKKSYSLNDRDHRKLLVADGATAIVGGVNMSTAYQADPVGPPGDHAPRPPQHWRDTDLELTGPAAAQLQALFLEHWRSQRGPPPGGPERFPTPPAAGQTVVRIIGSSPDHAVPRYYVTLISAIRGAEKSVTVSAAYFAPTHDELEALVDAARRGVDVRLLLPDRSDSALAIAVGHSYYGALLRAGARIYETHDLVLHTKTVVVDGVWSVIGSSNFDRRSVIYNDEVDCVVLGGDTAGALEAMFEDDRRNAHAVDLETWRRRAVGERLFEAYARIWENLL